MANNRIAYGLAKEKGIDTTGMSPKEVWKALNEKGITQAKADKIEKDKRNERKYNDTAPEKPKKKLAVNTPEAEELYNDIQAGKRFTPEQLLNHPAVKELEAKAQKASELAEKKPPLTDEQAQAYETKFLRKARNVPKGFRADIITGLPASGKSSKRTNALIQKYGSFEFDNDEIKKLIDGYDEWGAAYVHKDSKDVQKRALKEFLGGKHKGKNLAIPIIGDDEEKVKGWITKLQNAGYNVGLHHIEISNQESLNREVGRALDTGRKVPSSKIIDYGDKPTKVYKSLKKQKLKGVTYYD